MVRNRERVDVDRDERVETIHADELRDGDGVGVRDAPTETYPTARAAPDRPVRPIVPRGSSIGGTLAAIAGIVVVGLLVLFLIPVFTEDDEVGVAGATIDEITDSPGQFLGRTVTVSGEVDAVLGPRAFTIGGDDFIGEDELLVVGANNLPQLIGRSELPGRAAGELLAEDDVVQVTGPVRRFDLAAFEREIGFDLDDNLFRDWAGRPAIVASSLELTPRLAGVGALATLDEVLDDPAAYYGRRVTVFGEVDEMIGPRAFTLADNDLVGDDELLVVGATRLPAVQGRAAEEPLLEDDLVMATGPVRQFNLAEVEREVGFDLDDGLFRDWAGRPVLIARSLELSPGVPGAGIATTIEEITDDPAAFFGATVTVGGTVDRMVGPRAFVLDNSELVTEDHLLVVSADRLPMVQGRPAAAPLLEEDYVLVTGPVRRFNLAAVEREVGVDLDDGLFAEWAGRPAVVARAVKLSPRLGVEPAGVPVGLPELVDNPNRFFGGRVTTTGRVTRVLGPNAVVLNDRLLVAGAGDDLPGDLREGDAIQVTGRFRRFDLGAFERELGTDLQDNLFAGWRDRPALIARSAQLVPRLEPAPGAAVPTPPPPTAGGPVITNLTTIFNEPDKASLVGRQVRVMGVLVRSVPGDVAFWVGPSDDERVLMVLGNEARTPGPTEGKVNVNPGQMVIVTGTVRALPGPAEARQRWNLDEATAAELARHQIYVEVQELGVVQR